MVLNLAHHRDTTGSTMQCFPDLQQHAFAVLVPLMIPEAEFLDALFTQKLQSHGIMLNLFRQAVLKAIQLNGQLCRRAIEVQIVVADPTLATKLEPGKSSGSQGEPKLFFLVSLVAAHHAGDAF